MSLWRELIEKTGKRPYDNGLLFEYGLVSYKIYQNGASDTRIVPVTMATYDAFETVADAFPSGSAERKIALEWCYRAYAWKSPNFNFESYFTFRPGERDGMLAELMQYPDFNRFELLSHPDFDKVKDTGWYRQASSIYVTLAVESSALTRFRRLKTAARWFPSHR